jgi:hypothetical protein
MLSAWCCLTGCSELWARKTRACRQSVRTTWVPFLLPTISIVFPCRKRRNVSALCNLDFKGLIVRRAVDRARTRSPFRPTIEARLVLPTATFPDGEASLTDDSQRSITTTRAIRKLERTGQLFIAPKDNATLHQWPMFTGGRVCHSAAVALLTKNAGRFGYRMPPTSIRQSFFFNRLASPWRK